MENILGNKLPIELQRKITLFSRAPTANAIVNQKFKLFTVIFTRGIVKHHKNYIDLDEYDSDDDPTETILDVTANYEVATFDVISKFKPKFDRFMGQEKEVSSAELFGLSNHRWLFDEGILRDREVFTDPDYGEEFLDDVVTAADEEDLDALLEENAFKLTKEYISFDFSKASPGFIYTRFSHIPKNEEINRVRKLCHLRAKRA
tara:strand:- start:8511 stop:9122 length:612 start_codon:yes stop_codon:yes gene_type:complete